MANVNIAQLRTTLQGLAPSAVVKIHASVLLQILNAYKVSAGSDVTASTVTPSDPLTVIDLTRF